ncbi:MAG: pyruvate formate lyase family protein, partial [Clostridia bacterium]
MMEFYTAGSEKRPIRLSEETRRFAEESLYGKYGDEAMRNFTVSMDDTEGFETLSELEKYDAMIRKIAREAPLRYCPGEKISGAATLGGSIYHCVPAFYQNAFVQSSVSHLTVDFKSAVERGMAAKEREIADRMRQGGLDPYQEATLRSMANAMEALRIWHARYVAYLKEKDLQIYRNLRQVPFGAARNFREAVQSVWFLFAFERLCGNWPGIGRLDEILGGFLKQDLRDGALTIEEAREILAHFFIKGCEWIRSDAAPGSGDAQHYQNIVLGGRNAQEEEITNEVTYLILEIVEELPIGDFPITVRLNRETPLKLKQKIAAVIRHGGGIVAVYQEDVVLKAFERLGYPRKEALGFANDGCWEVQIPGKTYFEYMPFDGLRILLHDTLRLNTDAAAVFPSYEALYAAYLENLRSFLRELALNGIAGRGRYGENGRWIWNRRPPCSVVSLLEEGCIENARSYLESGTRYSVLSPHIGGAADTANSLYAIKKLVFEEKRITLEELLRAVKEDWKDAEALRLCVKNKLKYYGNDCEDSADEIMAQLLNDFARITLEFNG